MAHLNPRTTALVFGVFVGGLHLVWSVLVALGWSAALVSFALWAHMVSMPFTAEPFDLAAATALVVVTTLVGYVVGYAFALVWNRAQRA